LVEGSKYSLETTPSKRCRDHEAWEPEWVRPQTHKSTTGGFELATPRDRNGASEPQLVIPLDNHYPFVWLDAIHYKVKPDGRYAAK